VSKSGLEAVRTLARGRVHGGYRWALVMYDGELLCETCLRANYRQVFRATRAASPHDYGWRAMGLMHSGEHEGFEERCAHCEKVIFESTEETTS
jgi:hypothetical protein